ncbi:MAG: AAA family ATPase [Deltaproteobacteria bacterium]|nr:AAA family ATPase [Deltaproteobacteria bacterium]MBW2394277.1 AAA family ATPase [Deltaproteobacteria bacterium]
MTSSRNLRPLGLPSVGLDGAAAEALGQSLARLFAAAKREVGNSKSATPIALAQRVRNAVAELATVADATRLGPESLDEVERLQQAQLRSSVDVLLDRIEEGKIRALPNRLRWSTALARPDGVFQQHHEPTAFRDVAEILARLGVDLTARHAGQRAEQILAAFALAADDYSLFRVIDFYERHQACRLAVEAAEGAGGGGPDARSFGLAAVATGRRLLLPPIIIATTGPVASGKSTIAHALALRIGAPRVVADAVRDVLLETPAGLSEREIHEAYWQRAFAKGFEDRVYRAVVHRAEHVLASGRPVVLDACMPTRARRREIEQLAAAHGVPLWFVECRPDPAVLRKRLAERNTRDGCSDPAWEAIARDLAKRWEPWTDAERGRHLHLDTGQPVEQCLEATRASLPGWPDRFPD